MCTEDLEKKFDESFEVEWNDVKTKISYKKNNSEDIFKYFTEYCKNTDIIYSRPEFTDIEHSEDIFRKSICEVLDEFKNKNSFKRVFQDPSNDTNGMNRLGCTFSCPFFAGLCWGERGHELNTSETSKHHTSHQPFGLAGKHYVKTNDLNHELRGK